MQVRVSLSLRLRWIAVANPPYANIPYRLNRRTALLGINVGLTIEPLAQPTQLTIYSPF
jgi:hypothetical protein